MTARPRICRPIVIGVCAAALAVLSGCGGNGSPALTGKDKTAATNLAHSYESGGLSAREARCVADKWVGRVGSKKLIAAGLLGKDLKPAETKTAPGAGLIDPFVDAYFSCVDYGKAEAVKFDKARPNLIDKTKFAACANKIDKADAKAAMRADLEGTSTKTSTKVNHDLIACSGM